MSKLIIIAAVAENNVIGKNNDLPWDNAYKEDLKHFRTLTTEGYYMLMGRKTHESILKRTKGKALSNRTHIVLSSTKTFEQDGVIICKHLRKHLI